MVKPIGFTKDDVFLDAPKLYDNGFDIMFVRILKEVSMGLYTIGMNMTYNKRVMAIMKDSQLLLKRYISWQLLICLKGGSFHFLQK